PLQPFLRMGDPLAWAVAGGLDDQASGRVSNEPGRPLFALLLEPVGETRAFDAVADAPVVLEGVEVAQHPPERAHALAGQRPEVVERGPVDRVAEDGVEDLPAFRRVARRLPVKLDLEIAAVARGCEHRRPGGAQEG